MATKTDYSATIEVGEAKYSFDRPAVEAEGNMAVTVCLTDCKSELKEKVAAAIAESPFDISEDAGGEGFLAFTTETTALDYEALESVLNACLPTEFTPRYEIVANESDWGAHVGLISLW